MAGCQRSTAGDERVFGNGNLHRGESCRALKDLPIITQSKGGVLGTSISGKQET
jgi:hypothetical protein